MEVLEDYLKSLINYYYKPKVLDRGFAGEVNDYIKYMNEEDKDQKLSPEEYPNMVWPDLRDLTNDINQ